MKRTALYRRGDIRMGKWPEGCALYQGHRRRRLAAFGDGGEGRTRTFEAMRRLIYSQLPLPLGTLPRSTASRPARRNGGDKAMDDAETKAPITGSSVAAFMAESPRQSQPRQAANPRREGSNCHY